MQLYVLWWAMTHHSFLSSYSSWISRYCRHSITEWLCRRAEKNTVKGRWIPWRGWECISPLSVWKAPRIAEEGYRALTLVWDTPSQHESRGGCSLTLPLTVRLPFAHLSSFLSGCSVFCLCVPSHHSRVWGTVPEWPCAVCIGMAMSGIIASDPLEDGKVFPHTLSRGWERWQSLLLVLLNSVYGQCPWYLSFCGHLWPKDCSPTESTPSKSRPCSSVSLVYFQLTFGTIAPPPVEHMLWEASPALACLS